MESGHKACACSVLAAPRVRQDRTLWCEALLWCVRPCWELAAALVRAHGAASKELFWASQIMVLLPQDEALVIVRPIARPAGFTGRPPDGRPAATHSGFCGHAVALCRSSAAPCREGSSIGAPSDSTARVAPRREYAASLLPHPCESGPNASQHANRGSRNQNAEDRLAESLADTCKPRANSFSTSRHDESDQVQRCPPPSVETSHTLARRARTLRDFVLFCLASRYSLSILFSGWS